MILVQPAGYMAPNGTKIVWNFSVLKWKLADEMEP